MEYQWFILIGVLWVLSLFAVFKATGRFKYGKVQTFNNAMNLLNTDAINIAEFLILLDLLDYKEVEEKIRKYNEMEDGKPRDRLSFWLIEHGLMEVLRHDAQRGEGIAFPKEKEDLVEYLKNKDMKPHRVTWFSKFLKR